MSDPEKLKEIQKLGKLMGLTDDSNTLPQNNRSADPPMKNPFGDFSGVDQNLIGKLAPILASINREDDTTRLFDALTPFLSQEKREKLDKIKKMVVIMRLLPNIRNLGLF